MTMLALNFESAPELSARDFEQLSRIIYEHSGIHLSSHKQSLVRARLTKRLRALRIRSFGEYCNYLQQEQNGNELVQMLDCISTNLTEFFREPVHFQYLSETLFPRWCREPVIRVLSAGCSSGEEPYSIAIAAHEALGQNACKVQITAGDISTRVLARAQAGIYPQERLASISSDRLHRFFLRGTGSSEGLVAVAPEVQMLVKFQRINLQNLAPFPAKFHAIFCRNVAIYFDKPTQRDVFERLFDLLVPGGTLFLGHSESMVSCDKPFTYVRPTVYERR